MNFTIMKIAGWHDDLYEYYDIDIEGKSWKSLETILKQYERKGWRIENVELM